MTDMEKHETPEALWPQLMARLRALPNSDLLAFDFEVVGIAIQRELTVRATRIAVLEAQLARREEELETCWITWGERQPAIGEFFALAWGGRGICGHVAEDGKTYRWDSIYPLEPGTETRWCPLPSPGWLFPSPVKVEP